ncbi:MAG TPA: hypothetical protein VIF12_06195 [Micavibrio sp.]|jgi:hypothetical protein
MPKILLNNQRYMLVPTDGVVTSQLSKIFSLQAAHRGYPVEMLTNFYGRAVGLTTAADIPDSDAQSILAGTANATQKELIICLADNIKTGCGITGADDVLEIARSQPLFYSKPR